MQREKSMARYDLYLLRAALILSALAVVMAGIGFWHLLAPENLHWVSESKKSVFFKVASVCMMLIAVNVVVRFFCDRFFQR